jgi:predicted ribosomally synthesized peptide with nif11-like leader
MSEESFEQFRQLVLRDLVLQERLREVDDRETFPTLVVRVGEEQGYAFTAEDVEAAIRTNGRAWVERWIQR